MQRRLINEQCEFVQEVPRHEHGGYRVMREAGEAVVQQRRQRDGVPVGQLGVLRVLQYVKSARVKFVRAKEKKRIDQRRKWSISVRCAKRADSEFS